MNAMNDPLLTLQTVVAAGLAITAWAVASTARRYAALPARLVFPKNYGDGGDTIVPKAVVWLAPILQTSFCCFSAWALTSAAHTNGRPLGGFLVVDALLLVLAFIQHSIMLQAQSVSSN